MGINSDVQNIKKHNVSFYKNGWSNIPISFLQTIFK